MSRSRGDDIVAEEMSLFGAASYRRTPDTAKLARLPEESAEGKMDVTARGPASTPKGGVSAALNPDVPAEPSINERRLVVLRSLLDRWIAEHPAILSVDAERAQDHQQAIASLRQMIGSLEAGAGCRTSAEGTHLSACRPPPRE